MEYSLIMVELVKIRILLSAILVILGLLLLASLIVGGIFYSRHMGKMIDAALEEETGP